MAKIVPILKPGKDKNQGKSYRPISLLSNLVKTLERVVLARIQPFIPNMPFQHGYKAKNSTTTALQTITHTITKGFNKKRPPKRTIMIAVDMSRAFDVVNHTRLIEKIANNTEIPNIYVKFLANYVQGRKAYTVFNSATSKQRSFHAGVPQGGVLSPQLFNIYMADMPQPEEGLDIVLVVYADDVTLLISHEQTSEAEARAQTYLDRITAWLKENHLLLADKTQVSLFSPDPAEFDKNLNIKIDGTTLETKKYPEVLGLTFDPKLNFGAHVKKVEEKAKRSLKLVKAITGTDWGQQSETITNTFKQLEECIGHHLPLLFTLDAHLFRYHWTL